VWSAFRRRVSKDRQKGFVGGKRAIQISDARLRPQGAAPVPRIYGTVVYLR
jgi:hypothetical protein